VHRADPTARQPTRPPGGDPRTRTIEEHLGLVASVARRYAGHGEPLDDLVQAGTIGLIKAVDRFEPERGVALSTVAVPAIEGEIRHHLRDRAPLVRPPRPLHELDSRVRAAERRLTARLGRPPTPPEVADAVGASEEAVADALAARAAAVPAPLPAEAVDDGEQFERSEGRVLLRRGWRALDERERRILELRFFGDLTQERIAREVGLSQAHVSRLIREALERLRTSLEDGVAGPRPAAYSQQQMASHPVQPEPRPSHSGRLLVRMPQSLHSELAQTAEREGVSLNTLITGALASAVGWRDGGAPVAEGQAREAAPPADAAAPSEVGAPRDPVAAARRPRWTSVALLVNLLVVGLATIVAILLLLSAIGQG
jgi:RNA polymerase sigma-B factor